MGLASAKIKKLPKGVFPWKLQINDFIVLAHGWFSKLIGFQKV